MCTLKRPYKKSFTFEGYKIAVQIGKQYFSPFTGMEYRKKKVQIFSCPIYFIDWKPNKVCLQPAWNRDYVGYTSVFKTLKKAEEYFAYELEWFSPKKKIVLLKIVIADNLHHAKLIRGFTSIAGKEILSCKKIKTF